MTPNKRYAVVGTGAIGGYYGGKLARAGADVHFLLHKDYDFVRQHGLQINSCNGSFHLDNVQAYRSTADMPKADVVLVGLKTVNEKLLRELLPPLLKADTMVVLTQNGVGVEADVEAALADVMPGLQLVAGLAFIGSGKTQPGVVDHQFYGSINLAPYSVRNDADFQAIVADFREAGVEAHVVEYAEARWKKAVWNMPFNGMTVALDCQTDALLANASTEAVIRDLMMEVIGAAQALGVKNIDETFAQKMIDSTLAMPPYSPSMKLDYDYCRPMEIEYLYSRPIALAREAGFCMSKMEMLEAQLRFIEARRLK